MSDNPNALTPDQLRRTQDPRAFDFDSTEHLPALGEIIGQERAIRSVEFAIGIKSPGHHLYALGISGTGKTAMIRKFLNRQAVEEMIYRSNRLEERIQEMIDEDTILIDTQGGVVGQVNGLSILPLGDYAFGKPSRITARTHVGSAGVVNIERETEMAGRIHNKASLILAGYLGGKYAQDHPMALSASITFEQLYEGVEGDSAACAELFALLSSLSELPLRQDLAVTGSVNQRGQVQAIGGVNEKIEGFYNVCRAQGLTGSQGVLIPVSNIEHLMLREDVVEVVREGRFHVYPIATIDEGIALLTGKPAGERGPDGSYPEGSVNHAVQRRLRELAERVKDFARTSQETSADGQPQRQPVQADLE